MSLLTDPQVMGLITVLGGLLLANRIPWSEDKGTRARISGVAAAACVLMGLGRAGVGDMTTLLVAGMAGVASASEGSLGGLIPENIPGTSLPLYTVTPYGSLYYLFEKAKDLL